MPALRRSIRHEATHSAHLESELMSRLGYRIDRDVLSERGIALLGRAEESLLKFGYKKEGWDNLLSEVLAYTAEDRDEVGGKIKPIGLSKDEAMDFVSELLTSLQSVKKEGEDPYEVIRFYKRAARHSIRARGRQRDGADADRSGGQGGVGDAPVRPAREGDHGDAGRQDASDRGLRGEEGSEPPVPPRRVR